MTGKTVSIKNPAGMIVNALKQFYIFTLSDFLGNIRDIYTSNKFNFFFKTFVNKIFIICDLYVIYEISINKMITKCLNGVPHVDSRANILTNMSLCTTLFLILWTWNKLHGNLNEFYADVSDFTSKLYTALIATFQIRSKSKITYSRLLEHIWIAILQIKIIFVFNKSIIVKVKSRSYPTNP